MKKRMAFFLAGLGLVWAGLTTISCDSVDAIFDCQAVCTRYRDCYKADYDVDGCRSRCHSTAATKQAADTCEACIGDMSCLSATFNCSGSCGQIVP